MKEKKQNYLIYKMCKKTTPFYHVKLAPFNTNYLNRKAVQIFDSRKNIFGQLLYWHFGKLW